MKALVKKTAKAAHSIAEEFCMFGIRAISR